MVRNRSWPAVSHYPTRSVPIYSYDGCGVDSHTICSFTVLPSSSIVRIFFSLLVSYPRITMPEDVSLTKSTPIVDM